MGSSREAIKRQIAHPLQEILVVTPLIDMEQLVSVDSYMSSSSNSKFALMSSSISKLTILKLR
jgi:hypothetical protein